MHFIRDYFLSLFIFCILLLVPYYLKAQVVLQRQVYDKQNAYNYGPVSMSVFDKKGRAYLATNSGIVVFDGSKFKLLALDTKLNISKKVENLYADKDGRIWFSCFPKGWGYYEPATGESVDFSDQNKLNLVYVFKFFQDKNGNMWLGSHNENHPKLSGLFRFDPKSKDIKQFRFEPKETAHHRQTADKVNSFFEDARGNLWIGTWNGLVYFNTKNYSYSLHFRENAMPYNLCTTIHSNHDSLLYIGVWGRGLVEFNTQKYTWKYFLPQPRKELVGTHNVVHAVSDYNRDFLLVGTLDAGLFIYDKIKHDFFKPQTEEGQLSKEYDDPIYCINQDMKGNWLIGNSEKGFYIIPNFVSKLSYYFLPKTPDYLHKIGPVYEINGTDKLLCLSYYGKYAYLLDVRNGEVKSLCANSKLNHINYNFAWPITENRFYINTSHAGYIYTPKKSKITTNHDIPNELKFGNIWASLNETNQWLWVIHHQSLLAFDNNLKLKKTIPLTKILSNFNINQAGFEVVYDSIFMACDTEGNFKYLNLQTNQAIVKNLANIQAIKSVYPLNDTLSLELEFNGINYIEHQANQINIKPIDKKLPYSSSQFYQISSINKNKLLLRSHHGFVIFDIIDHTFLNYAFPDHQVHYEISYLASRNKLCFSKDSKIILQTFEDTLTIDSLWISSIEVNGQTLHTSTLQSTLALGSEINNINISLQPFGLFQPTFDYEFYLVKDGDTINTDQSGSKAIYTNLNFGTYTFRAKATHPSLGYTVWSQPLKWIIATPFYLTKTAIGLFAIFIFSILILVYKWRIKQIKRENFLEKSLIASNLAALRSQMNPHFIFNSLNSINKFILKHHPNDASEYLSKFAKLIRLILENSKFSLIPLNKETQALELYVALEKLRLSKPILLKIDNQITDEINIQPLLLQPFIENSIWHGLAHESILEGRIEIIIQQLNNRVQIRIIDNGVGRKEASTKTNLAHHNSIGFQLTLERLKLEDPSANIEFVENNSKQGTEVLIEFAIK
jgi:hypothetical protein